MKKSNNLTSNLFQVLSFGLIFGSLISAAYGQRGKLTVISDGRAETINSEVTKAEEEFIEKEVRKKESQIRKINDMCEEDEFFSFSLSGVASGSFTRPKAVQKAYLYELCRSNIEMGIGGILIVENRNVIAHYIYGENGLDDDITILPDIDQNGLSEIVLSGAWVGQGYIFRSVEILELTQRGIKFFGGARTFEDSSGAANPTNHPVKAFKIAVKSGRIPVYFREKYVQKEFEEKWELTKKLQKFSLDKEVVPKYYRIT